MVADGVRSIQCPCRPRPGEPCTPFGDHLARYLNAETAGAINQDHLTATIATLAVLAPHVIVRAADTELDPEEQRGTGT